MGLLTFGVEGMRCFRAPTKLELRPLTVLLGKNNSGKSALARVPLFIASGVSAASSAPIDLDDVGHDPTVTFLDLLYGRRPHASLSLTFTVATPEEIEVSIALRIQNIDEFQMQVIREFELRSEGVVLRLRWDEGDPRVPQLTYMPSGSGALQQGKPTVVGFRGFLPEPTIEGASPFTPTADSLLRATRESVDDVRYLGPFRDQPQRSYRTPSRMPAAVGQVGSEAPAILASDFIRGAGEILKKVNAQLFDATSAWFLRLEPSATQFSLQLVSRVDESLAVNFADTGVGLSQLLPILVQTARDEMSDSGERPTLNIVEQPELHLHPAAHAGLADLYIATATSTGSRFIIETHSENLVLRIRRRISEGLDPNVVAMYFVDHNGVEGVLNPIPIDAQGRVQNWPLGVFSEDVEEVRAMNVARSDKSG